MIYICGVYFVIYVIIRRIYVFVRLTRLIGFNLLRTDFVYSTQFTQMCSLLGFPKYSISSYLSNGFNRYYRDVSIKYNNFMYLDTRIRKIKKNYTSYFSKKKCSDHQCLLLRPLFCFCSVIISFRVM